MPSIATPAPARAEARGDGLLSRAFVVLCLVCFLNVFILAPFSSLFPVYVDADLDRLPWFTGSLRGLMLVLGGVFAVLGGRMCDLLGLKITLLTGMAGAVLTGLVFRTGDPVMLTLLIFGMGMGTGPWSTAGQSYLISAVHVRRLGLGGALYFLTNTAGGALGSLATGLVKEHWSFPRLGGVMSLAMVGLLALAFSVNLAANLPPRMAEAHGFYGISRAQMHPIEEADLHQALVIVYADRWLEYGALLAEMSPLLDDDVIYARGSGPEADATVIADYPGRQVYYLWRGELSPASEFVPPP